jgi:spore coat protein CotH
MVETKTGHADDRWSGSMSPITSSPRILAVGLALTLGASLTSCATSTTSGTSSSGSAASAALAAADGFWDSSAVHDIALDVDESALTEAIETYLDSGEKVWVTATVTIDGETFTNVGLKLKGNSSLRGISADDDPATLPWIIRLDEYVDGQSIDGETEFVVRGNTSESSLNEAVALTLLADSGLASQAAVSSRFSVNGSDETLRLVVQNPGEEWDASAFGDDDGLLYKAESGGDYSYRGDDPEAYVDVFEQEAGDDELTPLIEFLQFINESDDATFAADLDQYLDVESFATYLAFQDLVDNFDDIDGPGNNSYLHYDPETALMTVVSWDLNLAFGARNGGPAGGAGGDQGGGGPMGDVPTRDTTDAADAADAAAGGAGGAASARGAGGGNILSERFLENDDFAALVDAASAELTASLYDSGRAQELLDAWSATLESQASDLIDAATLQSDADSVAAYFD